MKWYVKAGCVFDGLHETAQRNWAILVENDRIMAAGPAEQIPMPADAKLLDVSDGFVMPGLIDSHIHLGEDARREESVKQQHLQPDALRAIRGIQSLTDDLATGVTTARALGDGTGCIDVTVRDAIRRGEFIGPRLLVCAQAIRPSFGTAPEIGVTADGPDEMRKRVRQAIFNGADVIKLFISNVSRGETYLDYLKGDLTNVSAYTKEEMAVAVEEAGRCGVKVAAHCIGGKVVQWGLEAGIASLEHANLITEEDIPYFLSSGGYISDPNLILFFDRDFGFESPANKTHKWNELPTWWHDKVYTAREQTRRVMHLALQSGVKFALGTDLNHTRLWRECRYFVEQIGATPYQALRAVTADSAALLGLSDEIGTLEPGKRADILCLHDSALTDITALANVRAVMHDGRLVYQPAGEKDC